MDDKRMEIVYWSSLHGTGASANLMATSIALSENEERSVMIVETHFDLNNLEQPLLGLDDEDELFAEMGLDAVEMRAINAPLEREDVDNRAIQLGSRNLLLLPGTQKETRDLYDNPINRRKMSVVIDKIAELYDLVLIDANSGTSAQARASVEHANLVVVTLRQERPMIDRFMKMKETMPEFKGKKIFYLFGNYDPESKMSLHNIRRIYREINKANSGAILHSAAFLDARSEGRVLEYIRKGLRSAKTKDHSEYLFFKYLKETTNTMLRLALSKRKQGTEAAARQLSSRTDGISARRAMRDAAGKNDIGMAE